MIRSVELLVSDWHTLILVMAIVLPWEAGLDCKGKL